MKQAKRLAALVLAGILCLLALPLRTSVSAATASATLSGPGTVRAGDTIEVTLTISGNGILGVSSTINYEASKLTFVRYTSKYGAWSVMYNNATKKFSADGSSPINGSQALITLTFTVNSSLSVGDNITVSTSGLQVSDGTMMTVSSAPYSKAVSAPASAENKLSSLTVSNATLSPAFNENTTSYSAGTVPFSTTKLNVNATAKDSTAKISISGDSLAVGLNTVKITVTAESGAQKIYTISVTREQDPNYIRDSNNKVSNITVDGFKISPPFNKNTTSYVVWLPYETTRIIVTATPESSKASVKIEGSGDLQEGENQIRIICTAEDGVAQTYLLIARRAKQEDSVIEAVTPPSKTEDQSSGIKIIDINYALTGDEVLSVTPVSDDGRFGLSEIADLFQLFNIVLLREEEEIQPDAMVRVQIPLPEGYESSKCRVYRIEDDGTKTDMNAEYVVDSVTQEKLMVFMTDHFGLYALVQLLEKNNAAAEAQPDYILLYIAMPVLFIGGGGIGSGIGIAAYRGFTNKRPGFKTKSSKKPHSRSGVKLHTKSVPKLHTKISTKIHTRPRARLSTKSGTKRRMF